MILLSWRSSARLRVLLHDYFSLCPSHFLLNAQGQYCGVPTLRQCARCLPHNPLVALASYRRHDMAAWRGMWAAVFGAAQEVVVFSNSSAGLLRKVYAREIAGKLSLRPHRVDDLPRPRIGSVSPLHIGVVGQIGVHKGAGLIAGLAREIRARHSPVRISVLGLLESDLEGRFAGTVAQTGPYRRRELPQLVQKTGVNVMLFPSICPETFSYVVQEIIEMELPLACLNLGAQAERVGTYRRGLLLPSAEPGAVLDALLDFHRRLYPDGQRAADG